MNSGNFVSATTADVIESFKSAMREHGVSPPSEIKADGSLHRFHIDGQRSGTRNGAYLLHLDDHPAGWFQDFKTDTKVTWRIGGGYQPQCQPPQKARQQTHHQNEAREKKQRERALEAQRLWNEATPCSTHPYLERKGVPSHGLRTGCWAKTRERDGQFFRDVVHGCLLIPLLDENGTIWNLQAILPQPRRDTGGDKEFMSGCRKKGLFFPIGEASETVYISEGYATACSVRAITQCRVCVAFDCGNLEPVALMVRRMHPNAKIIIAADNDCATPGNPGLTAARKAAIAVGGLVSVPVFPDGRPGDWNDWVTMEVRP